MQGERSVKHADKKLGDRLRVRRLEVGMSQEQLAQRLGLTFQQVQKYEKGVNRIAVSRLIDISAALSIPVTDLVEGLNGEGDSIGGYGEIEGALTEAGAIDLLRAYVGIKSLKTRRRVVELVRAMSAEDGEDEEG